MQRSGNCRAWSPTASTWSSRKWITVLNLIRIPNFALSRYVSKASAHRLAQAARANGIRLIPQINCLGHQSWSSNTLPLLVKYPQFDETPGMYPNNKDIYCRSWCPQNPEVNKVVFALADEMIDAFEADAFHVGMDEVFIVGSDYCPRCHGMDHGKTLRKSRE